jgi:hypothetical protein
LEASKFKTGRFQASDAGRWGGRGNPPSFLAMTNTIGGQGSCLWRKGSLGPESSELETQGKKDHGNQCESSNGRERQIMKVGSPPKVPVPMQETPAFLKSIHLTLYHSKRYRAVNISTVHFPRKLLFKTNTHVQTPLMKASHCAGS